jgi:transposase, IS5 family
MQTARHSFSPSSPMDSGRPGGRAAGRASREVHYGHELNLTTGRSGLSLDLVIEAGNPADGERLLPMLERHIVFCGGAPRQAVADRSFASRANHS